MKCKQNFTGEFVLICPLIITQAHCASLKSETGILSHCIYSDTAPVYLSDLLRVYTPLRQLRSSFDARTVHIPQVKTKTSGHHSFFYAAPSVWNFLPHDMRHAQPSTAFNTALKAQAFKTYY